MRRVGNSPNFPRFPDSTDERQQLLRRTLRAATEMTDAVPALQHLSGTTLTAKNNQGPAALSRRRFLQTGAASVAAGIGAPIARAAPMKGNSVNANDLPAASTAVESVPVSLKVNGKTYALRLDPRTSLLDAIREHLQLTGSKKGCDHGQCGACTMLVQGRRINACLTLAVMHDGDEITTIEGLARGDALHPVQQAFLRHDGFQCGYCTPGQICSTVGMLDEARRGMPSHVSAGLQQRVTLSDPEIRERMSGNICRCAAYPNIVAAIKEAAGGPA
jgi:xanthine dehydrogenase YagT iron-sulfur-binding subunit